MKRLIVSLFLILCLVLPAAAMADRNYLIPDSNTRRLTEAELWEWDYESLGYIFNEIFARHGYNFIPGGRYDAYFRNTGWYTPNADPDNQRACYSQVSQLEWDNYHLIAKVRGEMNATGNYNIGGKSVWDYYSPAFDVLEGFEFVDMKPEQKLAVYSAPGADSWRGADGKAMVNTNGKVYAAGWESGWLLIMYETNNGSVRVGYIDSRSIKGSTNVNTQLNFVYADATITKRCTLTDDPTRTNSVITTLNAGDQVTYLDTFYNVNGEPWAYVETVANGQLARGFVRPACVQSEAMTEENESVDYVYSKCEDN